MYFLQQIIHGSYLRLTHYFRQTKQDPFVFSAENSMFSLGHLSLAFFSLLFFSSLFSLSFCWVRWSCSKVSYSQILMDKKCCMYEGLLTKYWGQSWRKNKKRARKYLKLSVMAPIIPSFRYTIFVYSMVGSVFKGLWTPKTTRAPAHSSQ